jgi:hypothetical protein
MPGLVLTHHPEMTTEGCFNLVMPGLVPGIHVLTSLKQERRGRPGHLREDALALWPGHDEKGCSSNCEQAPLRRRPRAMTGVMDADTIGLIGK